VSAKCHFTGWKQENNYEDLESPNTLQCRRYGNLPDAKVAGHVGREDGLESRAWRLDSVEGVRSDENRVSKYLAGAYGAVPRL
jgi:hypothetical protein